MKVPLSFTVLFALSSAFTAQAPVFAAGPPDMGTDYGHITQQAQIGAKTHGTVDCGRSAEPDLPSVAGNSREWQPSAEIRALLGTAAPEFANDIQWVNTPPLRLADLRGHPVFIRFWYRDCPMCMASAPLMNQINEDYAKKGLIVIGIHHSKTTRGDTIQDVAATAKAWGFAFPIAIDNSWNTIDRFWIRSTPRAYSSASFLIDQGGIIVWGHDLGRLEKDTPAATSLHQAIKKLIDN